MTICCPQLGLDPEANLGGAVYDRGLLTALADLGADVQILLPAGERVIAHPRWNVIRTARHRHNYYEYNWIFRRALLRRWRASSCDLVRVHAPYAVGPGILSIRRKLGVPLVLHFLHIEPRRLWQAVERLTLHKYDRIITISRATRDALLGAYHLAPERVSFVYPGVDCRFAPGPGDAAVRQRWGGDTVALFVGSLIARKNISLAIRAVARARRDGLPVRLVIAGEGPLEGALQTEAAQLGLSEHVEFAGRVSENVKLALYRTADLFVFPSALEGFGIAPAEAMACALPVVALSRPPMTELVRDGETGLLVDIEEPEAGFAAAVRHLASDRARRIALGRAASEDVRRRFNWREAGRQVLATYQQTIDEWTRA